MEKKSEIQGSYVKFGLMMAVSFVIMYVMMLSMFRNLITFI